MSTAQPIAIESKTYRVGTLKYTFRGVSIIFLWLLCGDFATAFFGGIFGNVVPLSLRDLHASNTLIGVMMGSIGGILVILFLPAISRMSDNSRSRWGRRIPFLAIAAPLNVASLIMIGFTPEIGGWLYTHVVHPIAPGISLQEVLISWLCLFIVAFHYLNMVLNNGFRWLMRDVVPQGFMGRILACFRIIGTLGSFAFMWYIFPSFMTHRNEICVGLGLLYLVLFLLMCYNVKEGEYPPVVEAEKKLGLFQAFGGLFKTCMSVPVYRNYFIAVTISSCFSGVGIGTFLSQNALGLSMEDAGKILAMVGVIAASVSACMSVPMGWLCDKIPPLKVAIVGMAGIPTVMFLSFFFIRDKQTLFTMVVLYSLVSAAWKMGEETVTMQLFPHAKFGQFLAALSIVGVVFGFLGSNLAGAFRGVMQSNYRMEYLWQGMMGLLALIPLLLVYRDWKRFGGPDHYEPPMPPE